MAALVQTVQVTRLYGAKSTAVRALDRVDLAIELGEFVAIMGPSGSGKSTLMNILGLLDRPTEGKYLLAGEDVGSFEHDKLADYRNRYVGFVFQGFNLLPRASATENVALPLVYRGVQAMERRSSAAAALEAVGLGKRFHHRPQELSGGEKQRVAIARAMVGNPLLLLADEPTGALDTETGKDILALFHRLHSDGRTIVLITHDPSVARHATRIISLADGRVVNDRISVSIGDFARQQGAENDCPA
jgi:putative ABC transport system ATP-binding protein